MKHRFGPLLALFALAFGAAASAANVDTIFNDGDPEEPPDGYEVKAGEVIPKWWEPTNTGDYLKDVYVIQVPIKSGNAKSTLEGPSKPQLVESTKNGVPTGKRFRVQVQFKVPKNAPPGDSIGAVKLCDKDRNIYKRGKSPLYAVFKVTR